MKRLSPVSALVVGGLLGLMLSFASCGGKGGTCSPTTCPSGCCNSSNTCVAGNSASACGALGNTCTACVGAQSCQAGVCKAGSAGGGSGGSGGGSAGGGSAGGGSAGGGSAGGGSAGGGSAGGGSGMGGPTFPTDGGCYIYTLANVQGGGLFDGDPLGDGSYTATIADLIVAENGASADVLSLEEWYETGMEPVAPATRTFNTTGYDACADCLVLRFSVTSSNADGVAMFLARSGSLAVHAATYSATGQLRATVTNAHLVEWEYDENNDQALVGGRCVDVVTASFDAGF